LPGADVLCLASGGGQQGPLLAAAGASVTVLDASPRQLEQDRAVAARDGLVIRTVEGDMADLSMLPPRALI
jgi:2-polyprenyl-3-methyl-5-hydroxy-6-metoxy-1,4-benzoquinol methylase